VQPAIDLIDEIAIQALIPLEMERDFLHQLHEHHESFARWITGETITSSIAAMASQRTRNTASPHREPVLPRHQSRETARAQLTHHFS
jgi:hypothetical protein